MGHGKYRRRAGVDLAVAAQPIGPHLQHEVGVTADQAQGISQVIAVNRGKRRLVTFHQPVHQQRGIGRDRVAIHQPQAAIDVVVGVDRRDTVAAKQRGAINSFLPGQRGCAHERAPRDLLAQRQLRCVVTVLAGQWQQFLGGEGGVIEHQVELAHGLNGCLLGALLQGALCLHIQDEHTQQNRQQAAQYGDRVTGSAFARAFEGKWHVCSL